MRTPLSLCLLAALALSSCAAAPVGPAPQYYGRYTTTLRVDYGERSVDSGFDPVDKQQLWGVEADIRQPGAATGLVLGLHYSSDSSSLQFPSEGRIDFDSSSTDLSIGSRWKGEPFWGNFRLYLGGGLDVVWVTYKADAQNGDSADDSDWAVGPYFDAGLEWALTDRFSVSAGYRILLYTELLHEIEILDQNTDADYSQWVVSVGYTF
jgi:opacity protein-like surface antigen